ncbi:transporter substrate-binding domain-containing protein [Litoribacillus peritrichatus]|uniref:Transporter substrate-binding domain-containing protein n=1 Tax=Litoribacillus peritrichatus TaxID=718191 RepID=A0ABP7N3W3_9GAMM
MKPVTFVFISLIFAFSFNLSANQLAPACTVIKASGNAEYPPYLWRNADNKSQLTGAISFLIDDLSTALEIPIELKYHGPWGRVQAKTAHGELDMVSGAFFTKPRTEYMDYIYPKFLGTNTAVWVNESKPINFKIWEDLMPHQGITVVDNSFGQEFDEYAKKFLTIDEVGSLSQGIGMLSLKRIDYLIYEENPGLAYIKQLDIQGIVALPNKVTSQALFLTISRKSPCNTSALKDAIRNLLIKLTEEGRMELYLERALSLWKHQSESSF